MVWKRPAMQRGLGRCKFPHGHVDKFNVIRTCPDAIAGKPLFSHDPAKALAWAFILFVTLKTMRF